MGVQVFKTGIAERATRFANAALAMAAAVEYDIHREHEAKEPMAQYEVSMVFNEFRAVIGYIVRIKDVDGFTEGYLVEEN